MNKGIVRMSEITVKLGDITKFKGDAIVNAVNSTLLGGGGVDGAIHRAAGKELNVACRALNGCKTGEAKITKGYHLPSKYIIHTVGPIYHKSEIDALKLACCYRNSLEVAKKNKIHSIAFPAISTGVYHYPIHEATKIAVETVKKWINVHVDYSIDITFMCFSENDKDVYLNELNN